MKPATVPICDVCWQKEVPGMIPVRLVEEERQTERCYRCKQETRSGIYVRRMIESDFVGIWEDKDDEDYKADIIKPPTNERTDQ